jgi:hypothetical protein
MFFVGEYFHEIYYEFEEIKPQILTYLTNLERNFTSGFSIPSLFSMNGAEMHFCLHPVRRLVPFCKIPGISDGTTWLP